jgi:calcineurin-like phosphoesterase family protein
MSEKFFISDTHFGHRGIIQYEAINRPFQTLEEHDEALIANWNNTVKPDDKVYHVGDFCLNRRSLSVAKRLNGRKILIMGNHDIFRTEEYLEAGFERVQGALQFENLILTHIPVHPQQLEHRFFANVHGHLHSKKLPDWRYLNVSVEHINLTPITLEEVYSRIVEQQKIAEVQYEG